VSALSVEATRTTPLQAPRLLNAKSNTTTRIVSTARTSHLPTPPVCTPTSSQVVTAWYAIVYACPRCSLVAVGCGRSLIHDTASQHYFIFPMALLRSHWSRSLFMVVWSSSSRSWSWSWSRSRSWSSSSRSSSSSSWTVSFVVRRRNGWLMVVVVVCWCGAASSNSCDHDCDTVTVSEWAPAQVVKKRPTRNSFVRSFVRSLLTHFRSDVTNS